MTVRRILEPRRRQVYAHATAPAIALTLLLAGCGDDGPASKTAPAGKASSEVVTVAAVDYQFRAVPAEVPAGTRVALANESRREVHELAAMRLPDGETRSASQLLALPEAELRAVLSGPPAAVLVAPPGEAGFATLGDGTLTQPGRYLFVCFIPTGADPAAFLAAARSSGDAPPSVPGGPPHFTSGMYAEVTVR